MMQTLRQCGLLALLLGSTATPSFAASPAQVRHEIQRSYDRMATAVTRKDVRALLACMAPDFQQVEPNGQIISKAKIGAAAEQSMQLAGPGSRSRTTIRSLRLAAGGAAVNTVMDETFYLRTPRDPHIHVLHLSGTSQDFWVHTGAGWKLKRSRDLTAYTTLDGHPLPNPIPSHRPKVR